MKRKSIALLLALVMCLSLLSACGGDSPQNTEEPAASGSTPETTGQQPADGQEEQPSQEPEQTEPDESEEPAQEPEENAGTKFLAPLQEEWQNGFYEGEGPRHTYFPYVSGGKWAAIRNGVVYIATILSVGGDKHDPWTAYNVTTKESNEFEPLEEDYWIPVLFMDDCFWYITDSRMIKKDTNCRELASLEFKYPGEKTVPFEKGFLCGGKIFISYDLERAAEIPAPQREVEHGLKKDVDLSQTKVICADGTVYLQSSNLTFRLNTDTCEWEAVELPVTDDFYRNNSAIPFCGKYVIYDNGIYDWLTGERVFDWREAGVYAPVCAGQYKNNYLSYFGGEQYLGYNGSEFRWVNLKDLSMSDPLPFPEKVFGSSDHVVILDDTYCVYYDQYGLFLWNYNTGEEETIMLSED